MKTLVSKVIIVLLALIFTAASTFAANRDSLLSKRRRGSTQTRTSVPSHPSSSDHNIIKEDGKNVAYKKKNVLDFDDSLIEGEVKNPSEFYFVHKPEEKFGTLVQKRKNFNKEMLRDSVLIR
jgi:hypothetical protein